MSEDTREKEPISLQERRGKSVVSMFMSDLWEPTRDTPTGKAYGGIAGRFWMGEKGASERYAASALFGYPIPRSDKEQAASECRALVADYIRREVAARTGLEQPLEPDDARIEWYEVWHKLAVPVDEEEEDPQKQMPMQKALQRFMQAAAYTRVAKKAGASLRDYLRKRGDDVPQQVDQADDLRMLVRRLREDATRSIDRQRAQEADDD